MRDRKYLVAILEKASIVISGGSVERKTHRWQHVTGFRGKLRLEDRAAGMALETGSVVKKEGCSRG